MSEIKRVAAYCRVSTDRGEQRCSLKSQIEFFTDYIKGHSDWVLEGIYADEGASGTSVTKRAEFLAMLDRARNGLIDIILTKEVSRFARNTVDTLQYTRELKALGVGVIFINDNINTLDSDGELRLTIMSSIAQEESRRISQRVRWGQQRRMEQGIVFGNGLYGYNIDKGVLTVNESEAAGVILIYKMYTQERKSLCSIAKELNELNIPTRTGRQWTGTTVLKILRNEKYKGDLISKKTVTPDYLTHKKQSNDGEDCIEIINHHEAIIERELWDRTAQELSRRSRDRITGRHHSTKDWCSGKIICRKCGSSYIRKTVRQKNGNLYVCWRCAGAIRLRLGMSGKCTNPSVNDKALRECIMEMLSAVDMLAQDMSEEMTKDIIKITDKNSEKELRKINLRLVRTEERRKKALDLLVEGIISKKEFELLREIYDNEEYGLTNKKSQLMKADKTVDTQAALILAGGLTLGAVEDSFDQILADLVELIEIDNKDIIINFSFCSAPLVFNVHREKGRYKATFYKRKQPSSF